MRSPVLRYLALAMTVSACGGADRQGPLQAVGRLDLVEIARYGWESLADAERPLSETETRHAGGVLGDVLSVGEDQDGNVYALDASFQKIVVFRRDGTFDRLYPLRVVATAGALVFFLRAYRRLATFEWSFSWQAVALGAAVFAIWLALQPWHGSASPGATSDGLAGMPPLLAAAWIVFRILGYVVTVPLAEELAFRGFLTRRLIDEHFDSVPMGQFTWWSFIVSSVLFGLLHDSWLAGTLAGMLFAAALYHRGRLIDAVVAHATANGLIASYAYVTGNWAALS
jgi:CAAX prenyl protease-like protein